MVGAGVAVHSKSGVFAMPLNLKYPISSLMILDWSKIWESTVNTVDVQFLRQKNIPANPVASPVLGNLKERSVLLNVGLWAILIIKKVACYGREK
jgi:hypothetical protein